MKNMSKVFAFVLALAMILTTYQPTTTYAATKAPTISAKKMTLQVGSKKTLTIKNAGKNATLKWSSNKKTVATVSKKGVVKAVKAGTANVKCKVVTKSKKQYTLTCKVTVKNAAVSKTVSTQKALATALKDKNVKNLTIKTDKEVAFNIPSGNYGKVNLTVDAPNADVVNAGTFKSINIKAIKPNTWKEKAKGNTITVTADDARIVVEAGASLSKVTVSQEGGKIKIEAAGTIDAIQIDAAVDVSLAVDGTVGEVAVSAPAKVAVEGKTTTAIPVKVEETAKGADVTSSTPVEVKAATEISLNLSKGAEGSKVETTGENAQVAVKNDTTDVIKVTTPAGTQEVAKDTTSKVDNTGKVTDTTTNTSGDNNGGSTGGGSTSGGGSSSSGGSTSGGGSSSGGSVTPAPTPDPDPAQTFKLKALHVFEKNKIDVEIPTEIIESNKDKIIVTDENGVTQKIDSLKDMDDEEEVADNEDNDDEDYDDDDDDGTEWYRYMLTFASNLNPGTYTLSYIAGNTEYKGTFWFEADDFEKTAAAAEKVKEEFFEKTFEILPEGKENTWYAYKQLSKKVSEYAGEEYYADVFGGCDEKYIEKDGKTGLNVSIRVQAGEGDVTKDITGMVYFTFSGGSVTPELPAGALDEISVLSKNKISVYPSDIEEVPETLAKENVSVKNQQGETVEVAEIKRDTDGNGGYYITLASGLKDGEYTFTMILEGKKYAGTYTVNNDVLNKMDKLENLITEYEETIPKISSSALKEPGFCINALKDGIAEQMEKDEDYDNLYINVYYEGNPVIEDSKLTADVYVAIYDYHNKYAKHERYDTVIFECSENEVHAETPSIVCKMKNSIVVEYANNQQYICMEKEKGTPTEDDWNWKNIKDSEWTDNIGNIEFEDLKTGVSYVVWTRIIATNMVAQSEEFTLTEGMNPVGSVIKALGDKEIDATVTEWKQGGLVVRVPVNVAIAWYGDRDDENACVKITSSEEKFGDFTDDDHAADLDNKVRLNTNELGDGYIEFIGVENLGEGEKTFTFSIQTVYNGKVMAEQAYTAKFTIPQDTLDKKPSENAGE